MTRSKLKERLARQGRLRAIPRVPSGSPGALVLRAAGELAKADVIFATHALVRRGVRMLRAKRALEAVVETGEAVLYVPTIESLEALAAELQEAGFKATRLTMEPVDVRAIRTALGLSQEQFALRFNLDLTTFQSWEQGRHVPDRASCNYLRVIARLPREAALAQEEEVPVASAGACPELAAADQTSR